MLENEDARRRLKNFKANCITLGIFITKNAQQYRLNPSKNEVCWHLVTLLLNCLRILKVPQAFDKTLEDARNFQKGA